MSEGMVARSRLEAVEAELAAAEARLAKVQRDARAEIERQSLKLNEYQTELQLTVEALERANSACESSANRMMEVCSERDAALLRLEHAHEWIQAIADEDCPYGAADFDACGTNRRHGICRAHAAAKVLAQDYFKHGPGTAVKGTGPLSQSEVAFLDHLESLHATSAVEGTGP